MISQDDTQRMLDHRMLDRMLFFTDAVFAIVLTLLVLELRPPEGTTETELTAGLSHMFREFAAYGISFALGGAFWMAHMRNLKSMVTFDWATAAVNLLHLLMVGLIPFAAAMLGKHIASNAAFIVYSAVIMAVSLSGGLVWWVASRGGGKLLDMPIPLRWRIAVLLRVAGIGICFAAGLGLTAYGQVELARFCWVLLIPIMLFARLVGGKNPRKAAVAAPA